MTIAATIQKVAAAVRKMLAENTQIPNDTQWLEEKDD
jgi:hypothetical protein